MMRRGCVAIALALMGCHAPVSSNPAAHAQPDPPTVAAELESELAKVERALRERDDPALYERLLLLQVALAADRSPASLEEALERARRSIARAREQRSRSDARASVDHDDKDRGIERDAIAREHLRRQLEAESSKMESERERLRKQLKQAEAKPRAPALPPPPPPPPPPDDYCAPSDPLCAEVEEGRMGKPDGVRAARVVAPSAPSGLEDRLRASTARVAACIPRTERSGGIRLEVTARIDKQGALREPHVSGVVGPGAAACIADVFRSIRVDNPSGASHVVIVPLWVPSDG